MALSYKARRGWALVILLIGLPVYIIAAVSLIALIDRPSVLVELLIYVDFQKIDSSYTKVNGQQNL